MRNKYEGREVLEGMSLDVKKGKKGNGLEGN